MAALEFLGKSIAVLCGGTSAERDLSLKGGADVAEALRARGYRVTIVDLTPALDLVAALRRVDVVFVCLHGPLGEDGSVQGFLEVLKIPYTFSGVVTQSVCVDKVRTQRYLRGCEPVRLIPDQLLADGAPLRVPPPCMVKDPQSGSSRGVWKCDTADEVRAAAAQCAGPRCLVEQFISGVDLVVCVNDGEALPAMEFKTDKDWQDLASKNDLWGWAGADGSDGARAAIEKICPATLPAAVVDEARDTALAIYDFLEVEGAMNFEFRVTVDGAAVYFVEVSSVPAMTRASVHACCAEAAGLSFEDVAERILLTARLKLA
ncbi:D-alanine--D-alanine ligase-like protein [Aureococcus anophagefferens]|nr:D-alanine--D-alanine ligase-like protein [Aureococcus anophagefferens]